MAYENIIIVIIIAGIVIFGAKKIPELARSMGKAQAEYEKAKRQARQELEPSYKQSVDRTKLEEIASKLGIENPSRLADEDLKDAIQQHLNR